MGIDVEELVVVRAGGDASLSFDVYSIEEVATISGNYTRQPTSVVGEQLGQLTRSWSSSDFVAVGCVRLPSSRNEEGLRNVDQSALWALSRHDTVNKAVVVEVHPITGTSSSSHPVALSLPADEYMAQDEPFVTAVWLDIDSDGHDELLIRNHALRGFEPGQV